MPPGTIRICLNFPGFKDPENVISAPKSSPRAGHDQEKEANYSDSKEADFLEDKRGGIPTSEQPAGIFPQ